MRAQSTRVFRFTTVRVARWRTVDLILLNHGKIWKKKTFLRLRNLSKSTNKTVVLLYYYCCTHWAMNNAAGGLDENAVYSLLLFFFQSQVSRLCGAIIFYRSFNGIVDKLAEKFFPKLRRPSDDNGVFVTQTTPRVRAFPSSINNSPSQLACRLTSPDSSRMIYRRSISSRVRYLETP